MSVTVSISLAVVCFANQCYPALVGDSTPTGTFQMTHALTNDPGYGGDVVVYGKRKGRWLAIHRRYDLVPRQQRAARLASDNADLRRGVTAGCINVDPAVYDAMPKTGTLTIKD